MKVTTAIKYKPIDYFVSGKRIWLNAKITDKAGVNLARCYFRAVEEADFVFVAMKEIKTNQYEGILPAPSKNTETIEYLFLAVNGANQVVKSQRFKVNKNDDDKTPAWQEVSSEGDIHVTTELPQAAEPPPGFSDSIVVDVAESSARFGLAAGGIYTITAEAGGATGTAASSTNGSTVSASAGLSTTAMVGIGAAVAAVVGAGIALGAGSSSSSDGSSSSGSTGGTTDGQQTYVYDNPTIGGKSLDVNLGTRAEGELDEVSDIYCQMQGHSEAIDSKTDQGQVVTQQIDGAGSCYTWHGHNW